MLVSVGITDIVKIFSLMHDAIMNKYIAPSDITITTDILGFLPIYELVCACNLYNIDIKIVKHKNTEISANFNCDLIDLARNGNELSKHILDILKHYKYCKYQKLLQYEYNTSARTELSNYLGLVMSNKISESIYMNAKINKLDKFNLYTQPLGFTHVSEEHIIQIIESYT